MRYAESVQRAIDYIEEHLEEELDLSSIAEEAYISLLNCIACSMCSLDIPSKIISGKDE